MLRGQVDGLLEAFADVPDPRRARGRRFALPVVLGLAQLAVACGAIGFDEIAEVAADLDPVLTSAFGLVRTAPSSATFRRVLCAVDPVALDEALARWNERLAPVVEVTDPGDDPPEPEPEPEPEPGLASGSGLQRVRVRRVVSMDGKTLRSARRRDAGGRIVRDQAVAAWEHDSGAVLAGAPVDAGDEIAAVERLVARLAIRYDGLDGVVLVADAKHTQHRLVGQINTAAGWWTLPVKANQPSILTAVQQLPWQELDADHVYRDKGHGRRETRTVRVLQAPAHINLGLKGVNQVIKIIRHTHRAPHPGAEASWRHETAYLLTSIPAEAADPARLAAIVRGHWGIEQHHWIRDTAYDEDRHCARTGNGPINLTCLRNTAITRHRATGANNIAARLRACNRDPHRALATLDAAIP